MLPCALPPSSQETSPSACASNTSHAGPPVPPSTPSACLYQSSAERGAGYRVGLNLLVGSQGRGSNESRDRAKQRAVHTTRQQGQARRSPRAVGRESAPAAAAPRAARCTAGAGGLGYTLTPGAGTRRCAERGGGGVGSGAGQAAGAGGGNGGGGPAADRRTPPRHAAPERHQESTKRVALGRKVGHEGVGQVRAQGLQGARAGGGVLGGEAQAGQHGQAAVLDLLGLQLLQVALGLRDGASGGRRERAFPPTNAKCTVAKVIERGRGCRREVAVTALRRCRLPPPPQPFIPRPAAGLPRRGPAPAQLTMPMGSKAPPG